MALQDISLYYKGGQLVSDQAVTLAPALLPAATPATPGAVVAAGYGGPSPAGLGLALATMDLPAITGSAGATAQRLTVYLCTAGQSVTVTKLGTLLAQAGVTAGAGVNGLALYAEAGTLMAATGDMTAAFQTAISGAYVAVEGTLTSQQTLVAGSNYYLGTLTNFTGTAAAFAGPANASLNFPAINGHVPVGFTGGQASFPGSITPGSLSLITRLVFVYAR